MMHLSGEMAESRWDGSVRTFMGTLVIKAESNAVKSM